jgi:hypothetical protein
MSKQEVTDTGKRTCWELSAIASVCLMLASCGDGDSDGGTGTGKLSVSITDAPIHEAQSVTVDFLGVEVKPADGPALKFHFCEDLVDPVNNPPVVQDDECTDSAPYIESIDLLRQTGGASVLLLDGVDIPAGKVNWIRLVLADPAGEIVLSTGTFPLTVPSGSQTGLKLNLGFEVPEDDEIHVFIDFDVRKSIVEVHNTVPPNYKLKPTLRVLVEDYGAVMGEVNTTLMAPDCLGGSIYVFSGAGTTADDIDRDLGDPVSSTLVKTDAGSSTGFSYRADFLEPGDYTVAFVCASGISQDGGMTFDEPADDPDQDDQLSFTVATETATVLDDQTVQIDF